MRVLPWFFLEGVFLGGGRGKLEKVTVLVFCEGVIRKMFYLRVK